MNQKFNTFTTLCETAFSHFSNGGFREGAPVVLKKSFLNSDYCKQHYSGHPNFIGFIGELIKNEVFFFIKRVVAGGATQISAKDSNDNEGVGDVFLVLRTDPRVVQWPTEYNEFTVPGDFELVEIKDYGINLPPVQGVPNRYEVPFAQQSTLFKMKEDLGNQPKDNKLPSKNTKLAFTSKPASKSYSI
jgi:hypothetical protein